MDREKRIEELESQVQVLTSLVQQLMKEQEAPAAPVEPPAPEAAAPPKGGSDSDLIRDVRERFERALGADSDDFEAKIGSVWLSRLGVLVLMTALVFFARAAEISDEFGAPVKVLIGFGVAAAFTIYGVIHWKARDFFADAMLGCGLATLYFTTYALFFIENMRLLHAPLLAFPLMIACLCALAYAAHKKQSPTVAGIGLFLAYYTVALSAVQEPSVEDLAYALVICTAVAALTLAFHFAHRWLLFTWAALIATHLTYFYFFLWRGAQLGLDDSTYFWISGGFLGVCYTLFSLAAIIDAWKTGEYRKGVAPMAGVNSFVFFVLTWFAIREHYHAQEWMFRIAFAAMLFAFAVFASQMGPRRNYLYQIFIAKTVIMLTLALQAFFSNSTEHLLVAMAIECLGLAASYRRSGLVTFKVLGLALMGIVFVGTLASVRIPGTVALGPYAVPANWFSVVGVALSFLIVAWFYEKFVRRIKPHERTVKGQWFLADTLLDVPSASFAIIHSSAAALLLLTITIIDQGDHPALPYLLFGQGVAMALLGLVLLTPQIDVASVLLLVAAHAAYHVFLWVPPREFAVPFEAQQNYIPYTVLLALFTYVGAYLWERYLRRFLRGEADLEHHFIAALPYLAATFLLATLLWRELAPLHVPAAHGALGMALLLAGAITRFSGMKASGLFALGLGAVHYYTALYNPRAPMAEEPLFVLYAGLYVAALAGAERLIFLLERFEQGSARVHGPIRTVLVMLGIFVAMTGLYQWSPEQQLIFALLALSVLTMALGAIFREPRYRWGALFLFFVVVIRAFLRLDQMTPFYQVITFAAPAAVLLVVSWFYTRSFREKHAQSSPPADPPGDAAPDL